MMAAPVPRVPAPRAFRPRWPVAFAALVALAAATPAPGYESPPARRQTALDKVAPYRRFIWVTRWDFQSKADIERICYNAAAARFTDVFFQVRGEATVFFESPYEPWAGELNEKGSISGMGIHPGWDPLREAVAAAHRYGLRLHAWVNVMPAWNRHEAPRPESGHVCCSRKSWLMTDAAGRPMEPKGFYSCLDPGLPEVRDHVRMLLGDMVRKYPVDGVHLDYIRYPVPEETGTEFSFHPRVVAAFERETGCGPDAAREAWEAFRRRQVTEMIRGIRTEILKARPTVELSAAVISEQEKAYRRAGQDPLAWIDSGLVDAVAPMAYVRNDLTRFRDEIACYFTPRRQGKVWVGIWPRAENTNYAEQIRLAACQRAGGVAIFSYESLFSNHRPNKHCVEIYKLFAGVDSVRSDRLTKTTGRVTAASAKVGIAAKAPAAKSQTSVRKPAKREVASASPAKKSPTKTKKAPPMDKTKTEKKAKSTGRRK